MISSKLSDFMDELVQKTISGYFQWSYADQIVDDLLDISGRSLPELSSSEFSEIDFHRTYTCHTNIGDLYLVYSLDTPGIEGVEYREGYRLYLHPEPYNLSYSFVLCTKDDQLYRLETAVRKNASNSVFGLLRDEDYYISRFLLGRDKSS